jgi:hypothetical protein
MPKVSDISLIVLSGAIVMAMSPFILIASAVENHRLRKLARKNRRQHEVARKVAEEKEQKESEEAHAKFLRACDTFYTFRETGNLELMSKDDIPESAKFLLDCPNKEALIQAAVQVREEVLAFHRLYRDREYDEDLARMDAGGANSYLHSEI